MTTLSRRAFLATTAAAALGTGCAGLRTTPGSRSTMRALLEEWGLALLATQLDTPADPARHGALYCVACGRIHGRCGDAILPFLHLARSTGDRRYVEAALRLFTWMRNVDAPGGAWTNEPDPTSWKGISVFNVTMLGTCLERYGDLLDRDTRDRWAARTHAGAQFVAKTVTIDYGNVNYALSATHALALSARLFNEDTFRRRARELARDALTCFTAESRLLFGEGRPTRSLSPRGCPPVDLGYNVEESLPAFLHYAHLEHDTEAEQAAIASLEAHLAFMLPDGGWDNSWGTRNYKWTYWGSRTSDGCAPGYSAAAAGRPHFALAVARNTELLQRCTQGGLLHAGLHAAAAGMPPCLHHTFCHAKGLVFTLDEGGPPPVPAVARLPREAADGIRHVPELATWLAARGPWRATVSAYDWFYPMKGAPAGVVRHATGGMPAMLWHARVGPVLSASLGEYVMPEVHNMQPLPGDDVPLTPRVEHIEYGRRYATMFDPAAAVRATEEPGRLRFDVDAALLASDGSAPAQPRRVRLCQDLDASSFTMTVDASAAPAWLVVPVLSPAGEHIETRDGALLFRRGDATVRVEASVPLVPGRRDFNNVPGFSAVPVMVCASPGHPAWVRLTVT